MISLCSVALDRMQVFLDIFFDMLVDKSKHVTEVMVGFPERPADYLESFERRGIRFNLFGSACPKWPSDGKMAKQVCFQHAMCLHEGIERSKNDYLLICDPDVLFCMAVDELYLEWMARHNLNYIGVSHPCALAHAETFFPNPINAFVKKTDLPPADWLANAEVEQCEGVDTRRYYLAPGPVFGKEDLYPNPTGHRETGAKLYLWALENRWRWLAFQTPDTHNYYTSFCRGTVKLPPRREKVRILYHEWGGGGKSAWPDFDYDQYRSANKEENDAPSHGDVD